MTVYTDVSNEIIVMDKGERFGTVLGRMTRDDIGGLNPRQGSIFLNEVGCMTLTNSNFLITGESKKIRIWDLREAFNPK